MRYACIHLTLCTAAVQLDLFEDLSCVNFVALAFHCFQVLFYCGEEDYDNTYSINQYFQY